MTSTISGTQFKKRLQALSLRGRGWPRKLRDQHILLKSMILMFETESAYTEEEVNVRLLEWSEKVGQTIRLDHVTLRRYAVDACYLHRDRAGHSYRVNARQAEALFAPEVEAINPLAVVEDAKRRNEERKRAYLTKSKGG